jgi:hypothetical protein
MKAIRTKYVGPTNFKGSRIIASDSDGNRVTIPYPSELKSEHAHAEAAVKLCVKMGWKGELVGGVYGDSMYWVFKEQT